MGTNNPPSERQGYNATANPEDISAAPQPQSTVVFNWRTLVALAGLPCLICVAAIDPGNLEVDLQAGAKLRYALIWALVFSSVVGWVLQALVAHLTIITGGHLAELCARAYGSDKLLSRAVFVFTELSIVAFDVAEVVGTAFGLQLLFHWPLWLGMIMSALDTILVLYLQRRGLNKIEIIIEGMMVLLALSIFYEFALSQPQVGEMVKGAVVPDLGDNPREGAILAIGILGSVIMSHNLFLHSWLLKERRRGLTDPDVDPSNAVWSPAGVSSPDTAILCRYVTIEAAVIFAVTFLINACVVAVTAALPQEVLPEDGELGLKDAGALFRNVFDSRFASVAWGLALLASGHAATVTGTLASQVVCEGFLGIRSGRAPEGLVMMTRVVAIVPALLAALAAGEKGSDRLIVLSQVVISLAIPFAVIPIFKLLHTVRGAQPPHVRWLVQAGYISFVFLALANVYAVYDIAQQVWDESGVVMFGVLLVVIAGSAALIVKLVVARVSMDEMDMPSDRLVTDGEQEKLI